MAVRAIKPNQMLALPSVYILFGPCRRLNLLTRRISTSKSKKIFLSNKSNKLKENEMGRLAARALLSKEKRRTRSSREYELQGDDGSPLSHVPVLLGEVVDAFASIPVHTFVDCTLGAAGHSSAVIRNHPEMRHFIGLDVDPVAHKLARARLDIVLNPVVKVSLALKNFKFIKTVIDQVDPELLDFGVNGIVMDLGMSFMQVNNPKRGFSVLQEGPLDMRMDPQASLKAEDILNSWPEREIGRVLRDYGEESNWRLLQKKIVEARLHGGLHSTQELVDLIRSTTSSSIRGGRQGWIKTATRVFQGLRIAVNDELHILKDSLYASFDCLAPGGRLAVISFHSLEDRIVKQTFLDIIDSDSGATKPGNSSQETQRHECSKQKDPWVKQTLRGSNGIILTKRPVTPSREEESQNVRSRSAKLRVIQKV